jgi:hypothetical protein
MRSEDEHIFIQTLSSRNYRNLDGGGTMISISEHGELVQDWDYLYEEPVNPEDLMMGYKESDHCGLSVMYPEHVSEICLKRVYITDDVGVDGEEMFLWRVIIYGPLGETLFSFESKTEAKETLNFILDWKRRYSMK